MTISYQEGGQKIVKTVRQKQVVFYSPKYAERSRMERNRATEKARNLIASGKYSDTNHFGVKKYIRSMMVNTDSKEVKEKDVKKVYEIDRERGLRKKADWTASMLL